MRNVSVEGALRWLQRFVEREWSLLLPVALAFFGLPRLVATLLLRRQMPTVPQTFEDLKTFSAALPAWWPAVLIAMLVAALIGAMALVALALRPGVSVGEAMVDSAKRVPAALATIVFIAASLFLLLVLAMTGLTLAGGGQRAAVVLTFFAMIFAFVVVPLLLPVVLLRGGGPITVIRTGWHVYTGNILRMSGGLLLFLLGSWVVLLAIKVAAGSLLLIAAKAIGQPELGDVLSAILESVTAAIGWAGFYLLVAGFYRQCAGAD